MCFVNAVLHLLVHSPPFWKLFRELGDLKGQRGAGGPETGAGATPLVDAAVRFFEEFVFEEEPPTTQQPLQLTAGGKQREDEEEKENDVVDSFEPTYMYDAMKEKSQLRNLLVRFHSQDVLLYYGFVLTCCVKDGKHEDAEELLGLYLDALDEELAELRTHISTYKLTSASGVELEEEVQSTESQTEVGKEDYRVRQLFFLLTSSLTF
jgi:ubiquitin carboxyl-terminal hydrolase 10